MTTSEVPFKHNEISYRVVVHRTDEGISAQAFGPSGPASPCVYSVSMPVAYDMSQVLGISAVAALVEEAKRDITEPSRQCVIRLATLLNGNRHLKTTTAHEGPTRGGTISHEDEFWKPISQQHYEEFLELMGYHGYHPAGYGMVDLSAKDSSGKVWVYRHYNTCD